MEHTFNPGTLAAEAGRSEFEANRVHTVSFRTDRATQGNLMVVVEVTTEQNKQIRHQKMFPLKHEPDVTWIHCTISYTLIGSDVFGSTK